ncbi:protein ABIL1-like isoform X1 [Papaver somniferum]|uniref:protein ABIL1-like isoform X1 n=1 Tax=Papaver somniferum TaxID=3469 RepID=UPI000E6F7D8D|nr:protein ABIL1-like isoform X1 [Papaver somniferum]
MQQFDSEDPAMTFDEASMERSKNFVKALQELKNLRPQLYSAADYCEKSYQHSDQKQMVLDNLKDYAVRALVNAVDHLGTVAYKLTDLFEQQTLDVSTMEINISCLNQKLNTCQTYSKEEGLRQHQLYTTVPRHHKHYILPNAVNKKVQFSPQIQTDAVQKNIAARPRVHPSGTNASQTLSWRLASETDSTLNGSKHAVMQYPKGSNVSGTACGAFNMFDAEEAVSSKSSSAQLHAGGRSPAYSPLRTFGVKWKDSSEASKPLSPFRSFDNVGRQERGRSPSRSKSMLSSFFAKRKTSKI